MREFLKKACFVVALVATIGIVGVTMPRANAGTSTLVASKVAGETFFDVPVSRALKQNWTNGYFNNDGTYSKYARGSDDEQTIMDVDGNLNVIYADGDKVYIHIIKNEDIIKTITINKILPILSTVIQDKNGNYYVTFGRNRDESTSPITTAKLVFAKYDKNGNYLAKWEGEYDFQDVCLNSGATICQTKNTFFKLGDTRLAINDSGVLAYNLSMSVYFKDMTGGSLTSVHYGNDTGFIYTSNMTSAADKYNGGVFSSHDMDDDVVALGGDSFYFASLRDSTKRGLIGSIVCKGCGTGVGKATNDAYNHIWQHFNTCSGQYLENYTYTSYGNMIPLENGTKLAMVTAVENEPRDMNLNNNVMARNVTVQVAKVSELKNSANNEKTLPASAFVTKGERTVRVSGTDTTDYGFKFLTNYEFESGTTYPSVYTVRGVKISESQFVVMWTEVVSYYEQHSYFVVMDANGNVVSSKTLIPMGYTPTNADPIYKDGYLYFTNTYGGAYPYVRVYKVGVFDTSGTKNPTLSNTIKLTTTKYSGKVGDHYNVGAKPSDAEQADYYYPIYYSSDTSVAAVDADGEVTLVGEGTATITAKVPTGSASATSKVTVMPPTALTPIVTKSHDDALEEGETVQVKLTAPTDASGVPVNKFTMDLSFNGDNLKVTAMNINRFMPMNDYMKYWGNTGYLHMEFDAGDDMVDFSGVNFLTITFAAKQDIDSVNPLEIKFTTQTSAAAAEKDVSSGIAAVSIATKKKDTVGPEFPDFNHDGKIGMKDVKVLYSAVILGDSRTITTYDMDRDGKLSPKDVKRLYSVIIKGV